ncbi:hypothetical protein HN873_047281 [Arachis hypogaea]
MMKFLCVFLLSLVLCVVPSTLRAQLDPLFYKHTCPPLHSAVHQVLHHVSKGPAKDKRLFASLIRLHFHDCFVQVSIPFSLFQCYYYKLSGNHSNACICMYGCDASILLNDTAAIKCEQLALPTINSIRRLDVVNLIKKKIEKICPGVVSCVDILALATEMSSEMSKGPNWQVSLGRRDSITTNFDLATSNIPGQTSNLPQLISKFEKKGFDVNDLVALSGAHIIDQVRCVLSDLPNCTNDGSLGKNIANLDPITPTTSTRFNIDEVLFNTRGAPTINAVNLLASNQTLFFKAFKASTIKMSMIEVLVDGCDASILLNDTAAIKCEQLAPPTINSIRRLDVVNLIKKKIEKICPGVVSCVDILALATEMSSEMSKGPNWQVPLGRKDSITTNFDLATSNILGPTSNLPQLISKFEKKGLDVNDLVALSGAHIIDQGRCVLFRLPNYTNDGDEVLFNTRGAPIINAVNLLASNQILFFEAFKATMIKMSMIEILVG